MNIAPPIDGDDATTVTVLDNYTNGQSVVIGNEVIDTTEKPGEHGTSGKEGKDNGIVTSNHSTEVISKSLDSLNPQLKAPIKDIELNFIKADSKNDNSGYIVMEDTKDGLVLQLRAKSMEEVINKEKS